MFYWGVYSTMPPWNGVLVGLRWGLLGRSVG